MEASLQSASSLALLGLGLIFGLKHATEVDHVVAISTILTQNKSLFRSAMVGALWGIGHSASLLLAGLVVLSLRITIPPRVSNWFELCVAFMILVLGASALWRALRQKVEVHLHQHSHDHVSHVHVHFHEEATRHGKDRGQRHNHSISKIGIKPVVIGSIHGLAGSGPLTLLVLTQIKSVALGLLYISIFGFGAILGMLLMSGLVGLPFVLTARNLSSLHRRLQTAAAVLSIAFGLWYAGTILSASPLL